MEDAGQYFTNTEASDKESIRNKHFPCIIVEIQVCETN